MASDPRHVPLGFKVTVGLYVLAFLCVLPFVGYSLVVAACVAGGISAGAALALRQAGKDER